ncbi:hypothetical protein HXX76_001186 [Chlamydomonas incerta]|uniref:non-specific serine/threonine protein kinase n=1 Tax=Chlamydomonas incerta TaxID=51695 RepID=A0A835WBV0_CHLIN|nr:hypothetical protein HXX76_001186 [Chlamydomonas incerta]|eukprot:KAG2444433.1 hypothetical protein HXX76_001186 [Chlamydomonas incerta]
MASAKKLSDRFLIGEELGRGAYGQVYKGIDYQTGDTVAIKQISLTGIASDSLQSVMGEIDLLKTLNHKNIVKYIGSFKTRTHLYIILEFMENGSLASIIKPNKFGTFPESLVSVYIAQVLAGLQYLHEQGVVHRDIKGANILTTKDGLVKLADFGVAAKLGELEERRDELTGGGGGGGGHGVMAAAAAPAVVGTPYWMAPEVIEMTQVTSSSDIWSVGCLIVELLTGYPPYFELNAMSAMFRIVQDPMPPLPEDISPLLRDFLMRCFMKDAKLRPDARSLLGHEWLAHNRKTLRMSWRRDAGQTFRTLVATRAAAKSSADAHETINSVVARMMAAADEDDGGGGGRAAAASAAAAAGPLGAGAAAGMGAAAGAAAVGAAGEDMTTSLLAAGTPASSAPEYKQPSGAAAAAAAAAAAPGGASTLPYAAAPVAAQAAALSSPRTSGDVAAAGPGSGYQAAAAAAAAAAAGATAGAVAAAAAAPSAAAPAAMSPLGGLIARMQGYDSGGGYPPAAAAAPGSFMPDGGAAGGARPPARDLAAWSEGGGQSYAGDTLTARTSLRQLAGAGGSYGLPPGAGVGAGGEAGGLFDVYGYPYGGLEAESVGSSLTSQATELRRTVRDLVRNLRPGTRQDAAATSSARAAAALEQLITSAAANAASAASAAAAAASAAATAAAAAAAAAPAGAGAADGAAAAGAALLSTGSGSAAAAAAAATAAAAAATAAAAASEVKWLFLTEGGVLVLLELLDTDNQKAVEAGLDLLAALVRDDDRLLESLCLVGAVPAAARFSQQPWPLPLRLRAAAFVHGLCFRRDTTMQLFIAAGGLKQLCGMVADGVAGGGSGAAESLPLSHVAVQCLLQVFQHYATLPLNYMCRIVAHCGLVPRLYALLRDLIEQRRRTASTAAATAGAATTAAAARLPGLTPQATPQKPAAAAGGGGGGIVGSSSAGDLVGSPPRPGALGAAAVAAGGGGGGPGGGHHSRSTSSAAVLFGGGAGAGVSHGDNGLAARGGAAATVGHGPAGIGAGGAAAAGGVRAMTLPVGGGTGGAMAAAGAGHIPGSALTHEQVCYLLDKSVELLVVLSNADGAVKAAMCAHDCLLRHLDCLGRLQPPHLVDMLRCLRNLTSDPAVLPAIKDAGAIACLVPFLTPPAAAGGAAGGAGAGAAAAAAEAAPSPANAAVVLPKSEVQLEALHALYNLCVFNKKVHLEAAASAGIIHPLCSFAAQGCAAVAATRAQRAAPAPAGAGAAAAEAPPAQPPPPPAAAAAAGSPAALAAAAAQWPGVRGVVVPLLLGMVTCSSATRNRLYGSHGLDIFLALLADEDSRSVLGVLQALDSWLAEDHSRVEARLTQRDAVGQLVALYARSISAQDMAQSKLEALRTMLGRSSKLAVALAMGGLVPWLLAMIQHAAPINRVKILDIVRILYEHYPRPKEFIMMYKIQDVLAMLLRTHGRDADAVIQQAQRLLSAFDINVLL